MVDVSMGAELTFDDELRDSIISSAQAIISELLDNTYLKKGDILVIGCSSSEILGNNIGKGSSKTFDTLPRVSPYKTAKHSLKASKKGRAIYTERAFYKFYRLLSRIVPHKILMVFAQT